MTPLLELKDIRRSYPAGDEQVEVLKGISLDIYAGEMVAIVGASGSGKSTLMNILGCLDKATSGTYRVAGQDVATLDADALAQLRREHFGFIFQRYHLLSHLTAEQNVEVPAVYAGLERKQRLLRAQELLQRLGLEDRTEYYPAQLSGGQQQRVSIARALMNGGQVILADEPTGALDSHSGEEVMAILHQLRDRGHTVIIVTHDPQVAAQAERVIEIRDGEIVRNPPAIEKVNVTGGTEPVVNTVSGWRQFVSGFNEALTMAWRALAANKMRTLLTMLGIIIGIASVVSIVVVGDAAKQKVLADIGDEQSIEQSLSTFSSHMTNIVQILKEADESTLILFDELGAGTDPVEGAALAISIIENAREKGAKIAATTHYAELKAFAMTTDGVQNASCEFDVETLKPTYRLLIGIPGKSNAFAISKRLGLPESIIDRAKAQMDSDSLRFEDVLSQLESQRQKMEREQQEAHRLHLAMEEDSKAAREYRMRLEQEREKATERARAEAQAIINTARETADQVFKELSDMRRRRAKEENWQAVNQTRAQLRHRLNQAEDAIGARKPEQAPPALSNEPRPIAPGDTVELISTQIKATVLDIAKDGVLHLQAGILNITAKPEEVRLISGPKQKKAEQSRFLRANDSGSDAPRAAAPRELDLRGMMTDEAISVLEQFLDNALLAKLETVTIIHGKGTGALRTAVHQTLRGSRYVKSFRLGRFGEGENGVTIVTLR